MAYETLWKERTTGKLAEVDLVDVKKAKPALNKFIGGAMADEFISINAYLPRNKETVEGVLRIKLSDPSELKELVEALS